MTIQAQNIKLAQLITILINRQKKESLNNTHFAIRLGIPRSIWVEARYGKKAVGLTLLRGATRTYYNDSEVMQAIIEFLKDSQENRDTVPSQKK